MEILKNDFNFISSINAQIKKIKHSRFTHEMAVKFHHTEMNESNYIINNLIENVFDEVSDEEPLTDTYTLSDGGVDNDGEGGWDVSSTIDNIEFKKIELVDVDSVCVVYRVKLSDKKIEQF